MASPLVSVVTPVYNGEEHLAECVESIMRQTYDNWEYVLVDNCSSDRTPEIVEAFARKDSRVRHVRYDQFVDVTANYNRAFEAASVEGKYTKVVGADDWLYPECLQRMVDLAERHPRAGLVSAYRMDDARIDLVGLPSGTSVVPGHKILRQSLLGGPYVTGSATSVLLRSELVRQREPFYDATFRHSDTEAAYWIFMRSDFGLLHQVLTFTRRPPSGETPLSARLSTYSAENLRMLIRYGPMALGEKEYRRRLRFELRRYVWWHSKQRLRPSRRRDADFHAFHRKNAELALSEAPGDPDVRRTMAIVQRLLRPQS